MSKAITNPQNGIVQAGLSRWGPHLQGEVAFI